MRLFNLALAYFQRRLLLALSALGLALGVGVLFTVLAVINGFLFEFERTLRDFSGDVVVVPSVKAFGDRHPWKEYETALNDVNGLQRAHPRLNWYGLLGRRGQKALSDPRAADLSGLLLVGIDPEGEGVAPKGLAALANVDLPTALAAAQPGAPPPLLLGEVAAERMGAKAGELLEVISFHHPEGGQGFAIRQTFELRQTFTTGQFDQELDRALVRRDDLAKFVRLNPDFTEIILRAEPSVTPEELSQNVDQALLSAGLIRSPLGVTYTWDQLGGKFLDAVHNQRGILGTVFFFIVLVAAYQLVATLTLTVTEKKRDIGVLAALGATPSRIVGFFVALGFVICVVGIILGLGLGYWLTHNLRLVEGWINGGQPIFTAEVYKFEEIPVRVNTDSLLILLTTTLAAALTFSFLPAWRAAYIQMSWVTNRPKRPLSLTFLSLLIWSSAAVLIVMATTAPERLADLKFLAVWEPQQWMIVAGILILLGIGFFAGMDLARKVFLVGLPVLIGSHLYFGTAGLSTMVLSGLFAVCTVLLLKPGANAFFAARRN